MKIGILTQPLEDNYGGILQNWALQQVLINLGHNPMTIDYGLKYSWVRYFLSCVRTIIIRAKGGKRIFPHRPRYGRYCSKYSSKFIHENLIKTKPIKNLTEDIINKYLIECIIVGSDQVWRPRYNNNIENSFLDFAQNFNGKRIAYAASFGTNSWEFTDRQTKHCRELIKKFDAVSVREASGVNLCLDYLNVDATHVLDPTLLLSKNKYDDLCKNISVDKSRFIAVYCLDLNEEKLEEIKQLIIKKGLSPRFFSANSNASLTIEQWIAMFRDAEAIITDSFHGTVFSILYKKPFYSIINKERGTSRFESLLSLFDLNERTQESSFTNDINWDDIENKLLKLRNFSLSFLKSNLKR